MLHLKGNFVILPSTPRPLCLLLRLPTRNRSSQTPRSLTAPRAPGQKYTIYHNPMNHLKHHAVIGKAPVPWSIGRPGCELNLLARVPVLPNSLLLLVRVCRPHTQLPGGRLHHFFQARQNFLVLPEDITTIVSGCSWRPCTWRRGSQWLTQTSACLSSGPPDPRIWHRCAWPCPSEGELGRWHLGLTFDGTGTRWRLVEVERHTSFSRSALSSRACQEIHTESTFHLVSARPYYDWSWETMSRPPNWQGLPQERRCSQ